MSFLIENNFRGMSKTKWIGKRYFWFVYERRRNENNVKKSFFWDIFSQQTNIHIQEKVDPSTEARDVKHIRLEICLFSLFLDTISFRTNSFVTKIF